MILVYVDDRSKIVNVFTDTGRYCVAFDQIFLLQQYFANQQVVIVNSASMSSVNSIIGSVFNKLNGINTSQPQYEVEQPIRGATVRSKASTQKKAGYQPNANANSAQPMFVRSTRRGCISIPDMGQKDDNGKTQGFMFNGYQDFVSLQTLNQLGFDRSANAKLLLSKGILQLVPASMVQQAKDQFVQTRRPLKINNQYAQYKSKIGQREQSEDDDNGLIESDQADVQPVRQVKSASKKPRNNTLIPMQSSRPQRGSIRSAGSGGYGGGGGGSANEGGILPQFSGGGSLISQVFGVPD